MTIVRRLLRAPLLQFLLLGALLHAGLALRPGTIALGASDLAELDAQWRRETGRAPTSIEQAAMRRRTADEEMLVREALRLELDANDPVVRARLLRNIALIAPTTNDADALDHARRLDMAARDVLARRRLLQLMEARLSESDAPLARTELEAHVAAHPERYGVAARSSFEHRFLVGGTERPFAAGNRFDSATDARIERLFGRAFAASVSSAPIGQWVRATSTFGEHRVRVTAREPARLGSPQTAGTAAVWGALEERERTRLRDGIERLRAHYRVVIGDPA